MKNNIVILFAFLPLIINSCVLMDDPDVLQNSSIFPDRKSDFATAARLARRKQYWEAIKIYNIIKVSAMDKKTDEKASIGACQCFVKLGKYDLALNSLEPLPDKPKTLLEREKLSMAGEVFLWKDKPKDAESSLEMALSELPEECKIKLWTASSFANLGKAYAMNRKVEEAQMAYDIAEHIFREKKEEDAADECKRMSDALKQIIDSHKEKEEEEEKPLWKDFF
jgi:tetratricopeptide (TPR) repeat protein